MGADGGLSFCKVRDFETVARLLAPFGVHLNHISTLTGDTERHAHRTYLDRHSDEVAGYVFLEYGSFCYQPSWLEVRSMLDDVSYLLEELGEDAILADVLDDVATAPQVTWSSDLAGYLWEEWGRGWMANRTRGLGPQYDDGRDVLEMSLRQWAQDLNRAISVKTIWSVETWT